MKHIEDQDTTVFEFVSQRNGVPEGSHIGLAMLKLKLHPKQQDKTKKVHIC